jgi:KilA-N domain
MTQNTGKSEIVHGNYEGFSVEFVRSGQYVNLGDMAKVHGKRVDNWTRLKSTKELIAAFEKSRVYEGKKPLINRTLESEVSGRFAGRAVFAHPHIALQFAQWCSPDFALWVSQQIEALLTYGEVHIHHAQWTHLEYDRGCQLNRDDIKEMYGR